MAVNWQMSYSLGSTTMPPGCCPVVRLTPTQPAASRSLCARPARMPALLEVLGGEAVGRLFRKAGNGAGAVDVALAEKLLDVGVGARLVLAGEVEVDIGHLVALEAQEHLEGDVKAVLGQLVAADLAVFVRQVHAHAGQLRRGEEHLVTVVAAVMRRQGVDLGDAAHGSYEAGAHAAAAAHEVAVRERLADQLLRDGIQSGKAVADDGAQLLFQPLLDNVGAGGRRRAPWRGPRRGFRCRRRPPPSRAGRCPLPSGCLGKRRSSPTCSAILRGASMTTSCAFSFPR